IQLLHELCGRLPRSGDRRHRMDLFDHAPDALLRRPHTQIGFASRPFIHPSERVTQEVELTFRDLTDSRLLLVDPQLQSAHDLAHALHGAGLEEPGTGGLDGLGCQTGFGWVAETRETGKGPEPGHRLARDPSGEPSNPSIGKSDEPGFGFVAVVGVIRCRPEGYWRQPMENTNGSTGILVRVLLPRGG